MLKAVLLQFCATLAAATFGAVFFGVHGAASAAIAGLACMIPSALFALRMRVLAARPGGPGTAMAFVIGEFVKIIAIVGILVLAAVLYRDLHWGGLLIGLLLAFKANLFAFLVKT